MARDKGTGTVFQMKNGKWRGELEAGTTSQGTRRRISVQRDTKREALQALKDKQREISRTGIPTAEVRQTTTVKAFAGTWIKEQEERLDPASFVASRSAVNQWIVPTLGQKRLSALTAKDFRVMDNAIRAKGRSESTVARHHSVLASMLKDAARDGYPISQSVLLARSVAPAGSKRDAIPIDHIEAILKAATLEPDYSRWLAAFVAGLRPAEACGLEWERVDFDNGLLEVSWQLKALPYKGKGDPLSGFRVPHKYESRRIQGAWHFVRPKTDAGERWIPMHSSLAAALKNWQSECPGTSGLVWPNLTDKTRAAYYGGPRGDKVDRKVWERIVKTAGVTREDGTAYDLYEARHSTASLLRAYKVPEEYIIALMGHASITSTKAYLHTNAAASREYLESAMKGLALPVRIQQIEN